MPGPMDMFSASQLVGPTRHTTPPTPMGPGRFTTPPQPVGPTSHIDVAGAKALLERLGLRQGDTAPQEIGPTALTSRGPGAPAQPPMSGEGVPLRNPSDRERYLLQDLGAVVNMLSRIRQMHKVTDAMSKLKIPPQHPMAQQAIQDLKDAILLHEDWENEVKGQIPLSAMPQSGESYA